MNFPTIESDSDSEDNDSFYSFSQSESSLDNLSLSESDCDIATIFESEPEHETSIESVENTIDESGQLDQAAGETSKPAFLGVILKKKSPGSEIHSSDSSACEGVSTGKTTQKTVRFKPSKKSLLDQFPPKSQPASMLKDVFTQSWDLKPAKTDEYVSPFPSVPELPAPKVPPQLEGVKKPIIVPAGFDLSRLAKYKDPNHWHIRPYMRTGDRI
ncbi:uncharacterized protein [Drosophila takahashii]|uniref:uncharacterized protein n=1 Tax=Drosophila takahashii TaxID=29030 RepID=UPI00389965F9